MGQDMNEILNARLRRPDMGEELNRRLRRPDMGEELNRRLRRNEDSVLTTAPQSCILPAKEKFMKLTDKMDIPALDFSELSDENLRRIERFASIEREKRIRDADKAKLTGKGNVGKGGLNNDKSDHDALIESGVIGKADNGVCGGAIKDDKSDHDALIESGVIGKADNGVFGGDKQKLSQADLVKYKHWKQRSYQAETGVKSPETLTENGIPQLPRDDSWFEI